MSEFAFTPAPTPPPSDRHRSGLGTHLALAAVYMVAGAGVLSLAVWAAGFRLVDRDTAQAMEAIAPLVPLLKGTDPVTQAQYKKQTEEMLKAAKQIEKDLKRLDELERRAN